MYVFTADQIRKVDELAEEQGLSTFTLMENAGRGVFERMKSLIRKEQAIAILAGRGNNGGDGIVIARYLKNAGYDVALFFPLGEPKTDVAREHLDYYVAQGYTYAHEPDGQAFDVVVDALLGIGTAFPLRENVVKWITWANEQTALKIAVDMPTGVLADRGSIHMTVTGDELWQRPDLAFRADYTFALHGVKASTFLQPASEFYGKVDVISIGLQTMSEIAVVERKDVVATLPQRKSFGHKGTFGTSFIVGGSDEMPGSVTLAAIGAIRSGTGRLVIATSRQAIPIVASHVPEATFVADGLEKVSRGEIPDFVTACGIGPGIPYSKTLDEAIEQLLQASVPLVVDAGALVKRMDWDSGAPVILTPHPGEFSRLTGYSVAEIQENRLEVAREFSREKNVIVVLKGQYTVIAFPNGKTYINPTGNTGLAKGGSGDVLTGILVSFLATHASVEAAVKNAVYVHGLCAEAWKKQFSEASMTASDFRYLLPQVLKELERKY